jgi:signal transduction histidine kinase/tetratricopeptide (TPR) repeat protein
LKVKILHIKTLLFLCIILLGCNSKHDQIKQVELKNDSISLWIKSSKKSSYPLEKRKLYLEKTYSILKSNELDTFATRTLSKIAYQYLKLKDTTRFKQLNKEAYQLALNIKDTFTLADIHWNSANYYKKIEVYDSAYYHYNKAYKYFEDIDRQYYAAKMLYGMSFIKGRYRDYSGSEILITKAISKYKPLKKNKALYASYNHLAVMQNEIKEYDRALFYHGKALKYLNKLKNKKDFHETSLNNIGFVYLNKGEYLKALNNFDKILKNDSLKSKNIERYARVIDNKAYCKLLNKDTTDVKRNLYESLKIRDSINNKAGIAISKIHLSEYYVSVQDTLNAITFAKEANNLSGKIKNGRDYLASLKLLSKLDTKYAEDYFKKYITYNDSLQDFDRKIQNKFTRIAYETDEYIEETEQLSRQKNRILIIALVVVLILSLIYYSIIQRSKNKRLLLETEQQKANEQVYILTLKQQAKLEEEKTKERNRISQELHDDILGKLFGVRLDLGFLEIKGDNDTLKKHESFLDELQGIETEIREVSHKLNTNFDGSEIDFSSILKQLLKNKSHLGNFTYQLNINENVGWSEINEIIKVNLYRSLQEALQNIIKYAKAKNIVLDFSIKENNLIVHISDNGVGFNVKKRNKGIGLKNMKSRIQKLKGVFSVQSEIGKGTTIHFTIPIH